MAAPVHANGGHVAQSLDILCSCRHVRNWLCTPVYPRASVGNLGKLHSLAPEIILAKNLGRFLYTVTEGGLKS